MSEVAEDAARYERMKASANARNRAATLAGQDIGELPEVVYPERKERCRWSLIDYALEYEPHLYPLELSEDQIESFAMLEEIILRGGLHAQAEPRGNGKSTRARTAIRWAHNYGHRKFSVIVCASKEKALEHIEEIQGEYLKNERIAEDFPEIVIPILHLDGEARRQKGQKYRGKRTDILWRADEIRFADIPGSDAAGSIIFAAGIESSSILGTNRRGLRPDFALIDDPQDEESAFSNPTVDKRLRIINNSILQMAGPGKKMAAIVTCTPFRVGCVASQLLDRKLNPHWNGRVRKLLYEPPTNEKLWDEYKAIRDDSYEKYGDIRLATEFYAKNREAMDAGARVGWKHRFEPPGQISAVQFAMDKRFDNELVFLTSFQCEPSEVRRSTLPSLDTGFVERKVRKFARWRCSDVEHTVTCHVDVQFDAFYFAMAAVGEGFNGGWVDYGAYPDPGRDYYTLNQIANGESYRDDELGHEASMFRALNGDAENPEAYPGLLNVLSQQRIERDDGAYFSLSLGLVDIGHWGAMVVNCLRQNDHRGLWMAGRGDSGRRLGSVMADWTPKPGERHGNHWIAGKTTILKRPFPQLKYDVNYWKSRLYDVMKAPPGSKASMSLFEGVRHRLFAEHLTAERPEFEDKPLPDGSKRIVWKPLPGRENHFLDCAVGCLAAASFRGIDFPDLGHDEAFGRKKQMTGRRRSFAQMQREARREGGR